MDLTDLLKMGASAIQGNSDEATTGLDTDAITGALGNLLGGGSDGGIDLSNIMSGLSENGLGSIVGSWLGNGENEAISMDSITDLLGADKVSEFASSLGLSEESATGALADMLPNVIDKATSGEGSIIDTMLNQVGGTEGAMNMLSKMFK
ncbi:MAG: Bll5166 protein [uncultured Sulfurovum sp.]|uniref:Bll5166 protein n=1 Tax=uncultured Sulfurovum sp. TaxID=269237 RepID=A0A6S6T699_9BACT|nr:MAG: Bll5166 protein [uncultured Sulfurovum sp.]